MTMFRDRVLPATVVLLLVLPWRSAVSQNLSDFHEFYRLMRIDALEHLVFCYPTDTPEREPDIVGVRRDDEGRPVQVTRFFFGNLQTKADWTTMAIEYITSDSATTVLQRRTFQAPNGAPMKVGYAYGEDVLYRRNGELVRYRLLDRDDNLLDRVPVVSQSRFFYDDSGVVTREWRFASGKLHWGWQADGPMRPFGAIPQGGYFRRYNVDESGNLIYEELQSISKKPFPFGGGEFAHSFELNECGQPVRMTYLDPFGAPMADSAGVASVTYTYDDYGRWIERRTFDLDGAPKAEPDGTATTRRRFREFDGQLVSEERFDEKGNLLHAD